MPEVLDDIYLNNCRHSLTLNQQHGSNYHYHFRLPQIKSVPPKKEAEDFFVPHDWMTPVRVSLS